MSFYYVSLLEVFFYSFPLGVRGMQVSVASSCSNNRIRNEEHGGNRRRNALSFFFFFIVYFILWETSTGVENLWSQKVSLTPLNCGVSADKTPPLTRIQYELKSIFLWNINAPPRVTSWMQPYYVMKMLSVISCPNFVLVMFFFQEVSRFMGHISNFRVELKRDYQRGLYTQPAEILNWITFAEVLGKHLLFLFFFVLWRHCFGSCWRVITVM